MQHTGSRGRILECARELFYWLGNERTSIDDILKGSGVARSNFYYHFRTKEELGLMVLDLRLSEYQNAILAALAERGRSAPERLNQLFVAIREAQLMPPGMGGCPFGNLAASLPCDDRHVGAQRFRNKLCETFRQMEGAVELCVREGMERGQFRADVSAPELAALVIAVVQGALVLTKTYRDARPLESGAVLMLQLLRP